MWQLKQLSQHIPSGAGAGRALQPSDWDITRYTGTMTAAAVEPQPAPPAHFGLMRLTLALAAAATAVTLCLFMAQYVGSGNGSAARRFGQPLLLGAPTALPYDLVVMSVYRCGRGGFLGRS